MALCQLVLIWFLGSEATTHEDSIKAFKTPAPTGAIVLARFLCANIIHIHLTPEIMQGLKMMKYSANHPFKFNNYVEAFLIGFTQMIVVISVEIVALAVLNTNEKIQDVIMNFLALVVIAEIDDFYFSTVLPDPIAKLIRNGELEIPEDGKTGDNKIDLAKVLKATVTTSSTADYCIDGNRTATGEIVKKVDEG